jgi:hypothetical protein
VSCDLTDRQTSLRIQRILIGNEHCKRITSTVSTILHYVFIAKRNILFKFKTRLRTDVCRRTDARNLSRQFRHAAILMQTATRTPTVHCCKTFNISLLLKWKPPTYEVVSKIFRTDTLPTSTQPRATWHTDNAHVHPATCNLAY